MATTEYLRVREPFVAASPKGTGTRLRFNEGDFVPADDPVVKGRESLFEPVGAFVERTTARTAVPQRQAQAPKGRGRRAPKQG